jgi:Cd2+/Zn2+-exporting ATPase
VDGRAYLVGNERLFDERGIDAAAARTAVDALEGQGKTVVLVARDGALVGALAVADELRPETPEVIASLRAAGVRTVMLTRDNERSASAIAARAGVDEHYAQLLPDQKVELVRRLKAQYGSVAMVGDGINDAPALAASDLGIAMGAAGTDVAVETGDVVLMADDLSKLSFVRELSRRTVRIIHLNIAVSLVNIAFMVLAALVGVLGLVSGLLLNEASALIVIVNALRLLAMRVERKAEARPAGLAIAQPVGGEP